MVCESGWKQHQTHRTFVSVPVARVHSVPNASLIPLHSKYNELLHQMVLCAGSVTM